MRPTALTRVALPLLALGLVACPGEEETPEPAGPSQPTVVDITTGEETVITLGASAVGPLGGLVTAEALPGFAIEVPEGAVSEEVQFEVRVQPITALSGVPEGVVRASDLIVIEVTGSADWNQFRLFDEPVKVTLPFDTTVPGPDSVRFYVHQPDTTLEPTGFEVVDVEAGTITFLTRTFADTAEEPEMSAVGSPLVARTPFARYVALGLGTLFTATWLVDGVDLDSAFRPSRDGWYIPNYGAYYLPSRGGNCMGMVTWAKYWFRKHGAGFRAKYHDADNTSTWLDDATAIQLASRAHGAEMDIWNRYTTGELDTQAGSARAVALSWLGGLFVTKQPVFVGMYQATRNADGSLTKRGGHAMMIYRAKMDSAGKVDFMVYDPNHPNKEDRKIAWADGVGFYVYNGGTSAASPGRPYNYFKHFGYQVAVSDAVFDNLKLGADRGFSDDSVFPTITITSITGKSNYEDVMANEETTAEGEKKYVTDDNTVVITGTVLGGHAQRAGSVVDNVNVIVANRVFHAAVDNQAGGGSGEFTVVAPLYQGENQVVLLASKRNKFSHWAGFGRTIVESKASRADMTITMSWDQGQSDVDLYVREPSVDGAVGDTVYYQHRKGSSEGHPFLDIDNTSGYGPEHYYARQGTTTLTSEGGENPEGLYGDYEVRVHYYSDHDDDDEATQPISWTVSYRLLAFCPDPCENPEHDGFWAQGSWRGYLTEATGSSGCCDIDNSGAAWSSMMYIDYPRPDPADYSIPDPPNIQLP